jgi:signal transduction histidine kinase
MSQPGYPESRLAADESRDTEVARRVLEAADGARRRVARDLHDGAQQQIVAAVINLQRAQQKWDADPARAREHLDRGLDRAQVGLARLRELVAGIHPPALRTFGLGAAVADLASEMPLPVTLSLELERLPSVIEEGLYFFISEALTNIAKHAHASKACVRLCQEGSRLTIEVSDDGVGGASTKEGMGLQGMSDRISALDGTLTVASPADEGTTLCVEVWLPVL